MASNSSHHLGLVQGAAAVDGDVGAVSREAQGRRPPDTPAGTGDQGRAPGKIEERSSFR
jgi:hypothetical protein